jgi:hypothetical protein
MKHGNLTHAFSLFLQNILKYAVMVGLKYQCRAQANTVPSSEARIREEPRKPAINQQESTKEGGLEGIDSGSMQLMLISRHFQD